MKPLRIDINEPELSEIIRGRLEEVALAMQVGLARGWEYNFSIARNVEGKFEVQLQVSQKR